MSTTNLEKLAPAGLAVEFVSLLMPSSHLMTQAYAERTIYRALRITTLGGVMIWSLVLADLLR